MFDFEIGGKKVQAEVTFYTAWLYETEFQGDMLKDLFGEQDFDDPIVVDGGRVVKVDFTKVNWTAVTRVLWAACKTADDKTPSYRAWMKDAKGANLWELNEVLSAEVADCFFRAEAAGEEV